jgi:hypothetical protein
MIQMRVGDEEGVYQMLGNVCSIGFSCSTLRLQALKGSIDQRDWSATALNVITHVAFQNFDNCPKMDTCVDGE